MSKLVPIEVRLERRRRTTTSGCWLWTGFVAATGYGLITMRTPDGRRRSGVHRVAYEHYVGPIPDGMVVDHLCRVRACFNPDHLQPVTQQENVLRSPIAPASINARKTHCPKGHPYSGSNVVYQRNGGRLCRTCQAMPRAGRLAARERVAS